MIEEPFERNPVPAARMNARQLFEFYLLLPLVTGLFFGAASAGFQYFQSIGLRITYMALFSVLSWNCYGVGAKLSEVLLRPWQPSLPVVLLLGNLIGGFGFWWPLRDLLNLGFESYLIPGVQFGPFWPPPKDNFGPYVAITVQGIVWWLLAHWVDFRFRRVPRFGFVPPEKRVVEILPQSIERDVAAGAASTSVVAPENPGLVAPRLLDRLPENLRTADVLALEAEEHYTKVHTTAGSTLLLLRFSDAILEMSPQPGLRVHRSFWVSKDGVDRVDSAGRRMVIGLRGGLEVPVSRSYRLQVRATSFSSRSGTPQA